jgi:hypothetical protein
MLTKMSVAPALARASISASLAQAIFPDHEAGFARGRPWPVASRRSTMLFPLFAVLRGKSLGAVGDPGRGNF